jgi:methylated-DNA-[protein]-cysteine S-methyltransferase
MTTTGTHQSFPDIRLNHHRQPPSLDTEAARPGVDPCDVACEAMPAHVLADLAPTDEAWLREHVAGCGYCARQLDGFERLGSVLDAVCASPIDCPVPAVALPPWPGKRAVPAWTETVDSPVGPLVLAATEDGLCEVAFARSRTPDEVRALLLERGLDPRPAGAASPPVVAETLARAADQLGEYFGGNRHLFDLPLDFRGVTPFTRSVLEATATVDFGRLETYRGIAGRIGKPGATRAVGNALGRNPLPVVVPCHRIVRSGGGIGGYTGGLWIKERLLALEGAAFGT